jgi:hypothetical protein
VLERDWPFFALFQFVFGEEAPRAILRRTFRRHIVQIATRPDALQIGIAPGGLRRSPLRLRRSYPTDIATTAKTARSRILFIASSLPGPRQPIFRPFFAHQTR